MKMKIKLDYRQNSGKFENIFLKSLQTGLNMLKAHYEAEIKNSQENS